MLGEILQPTHLIFILIVALLFLGPKRLPAAGRALGQGLREFKSSITGERTDESQPGAVPERIESPSPSHDDAPAAANAHS